MRKGYLLLCTVFLCVLFLTPGCGSGSDSSSTSAVFYTVTYFSDSDIQYLPELVLEGGYISELPVPVKDGYTFLGWYTETGIRFTDTTPVASDLTLWAHWSAIETIYYTVTFDSAGGTAVSSRRIAAGGSLGSLPESVREGYEFSGWYTPANLRFTETTPVTGDITLTARWVEIIITTYTITFDSGNGANYAPITVREGEMAGILPLPEKDGYIFKGWYAENGILFTPEIKVFRNYLLTAVWEPEPPVMYTISYYLYEGEFYQKTYVEEGTLLVFPTFLPRDNYDFSGWFDEDGVRCWGGIPVVKDMALTGRWVHTAETSYLVSFNPGTDILYPAVTVKEGEYITPLPQPVREGYILGGWFRADDHSLFSEETPVYGNTLLVAKWHLPGETLYKITYESADGASFNPAYAVGGETLCHLPQPVREGYTFAGWLDPDGEYFTGDTPVTGDLILTAHWIEIIVYYTVTFDAEGGTVPAPVTVSGGSTLENLPSSVKDSYILAGWYLEDNTKFTTAMPVTSDITLKAVWRWPFEELMFNLQIKAVKGFPSDFTEFDVFIASGEYVLLYERIRDNLKYKGSFYTGHTVSVAEILPEADLITGGSEGGLKISSYREGRWLTSDIDCYSDTAYDIKLHSDGLIGVAGSGGLQVLEKTGEDWHCSELLDNSTYVNSIGIDNDGRILSNGSGEDNDAIRAYYKGASRWRYSRNSSSNPPNSLWKNIRNPRWLEEDLIVAISGDSHLSLWTSSLVYKGVLNDLSGYTVKAMETIGNTKLVTAGDGGYLWKKDQSGEWEKFLEVNDSRLAGVSVLSDETALYFAGDPADSRLYLSAAEGDISATSRIHINIPSLLDGDCFMGDSFLVAGTDGSIQQFRFDGEAWSAELIGIQPDVRRVAWLTENSVLSTGGTGGEITVWTYENSAWKDTSVGALGVAESSMYVVSPHFLVFSAADTVYILTEYGGTWHKDSVNINLEATEEISSLHASDAGMIYAGTSRGRIMVLEKDTGWNSKIINVGSDPIGAVLSLGENVVAAASGTELYVLYLDTNEKGLLSRQAVSINALITLGKERFLAANPQYFQEWIYGFDRVWKNAGEVQMGYAADRKFYPDFRGELLAGILTMAGSRLDYLSLDR